MDMSSCTPTWQCLDTFQYDLDALGDPDGARQVAIDKVRALHAQLKTQQRHLERGLEKDYWEGILASHPNTEADSCQFFHALNAFRVVANTKLLE